MRQVYAMPKAITLTERAAARVKTVIASDDQGRQFVRLGVKNGGCAGLEYTLDYCEAQQPLDEVVEDKGVTVLVDPKAILFLLGTQMDYEEGLLSSGFTFQNPNQTDACGCGESVTIVPVASPK